MTTTPLIRIRARREAAGLSQVRLARLAWALGYPVTERTVRRIETAESSGGEPYDPALSTALGLAAALGCTVGDLIADEVTTGGDDDDAGEARGARAPAAGSPAGA